MSDNMFASHDFQVCDIGDQDDYEKPQSQSQQEDIQSLSIGKSSSISQDDRNQNQSIIKEKEQGYIRNLQQVSLRQSADDILEDCPTYKKWNDAKAEDKQNLIYLRKAPNQEGFEITIDKLLQSGEDKLLIYFLIESEIYNNQFNFMQALCKLQEKHKNKLYKNLFCPKAIIQYVSKCSELGKASDILYIAFKSKDRYETSFYQDICKMIQEKINNSTDKADFFLTNFFRIMVNSKRYNKNQSYFRFPEKSLIKVEYFKAKILYIIQYVITFPYLHNKECWDFSDIEVIKAIIDYLFLLKTESISQVHYIRFLFDLIQPGLEKCDLDKKYEVLQYILECLMIKYDDSDLVKSPTSCTILLAYFESVFLDEEGSYSNRFEIERVLKNIQNLSDYDITNLINNVFNIYPSEFGYLIINQLVLRLSQIKDTQIEACLSSIFNTVILKKVIFNFKVEGRITQLCNLVSTFLYIFEEEQHKYSKEIFQILKYNYFIFQPYGQQDELYFQQRVNDYCRVIHQIIIHKQISADLLQQMQRAYQSVIKQVKEQFTETQFRRQREAIKSKQKLENISIETRLYTGLPNFGNTCYFNSLMQVMMRLDLFDDYLNKKNSMKNTDFFKNNRKLMKYIQCQEKLDRDNLERLIRNVVQQGAPEFKWGYQNDPQEYLTQSCSRLYFEEQNIGKQQQVNSENKMSLLISEKLGRLMCSQCQIYSKYEKQQFVSLAIYLHNKTNLNFFDLIKQQQKENEKHRIHCQNCSKAVEMDKDEIYSQIPPILVFQVMRIDNYGKKDSRPISFPEFFNFLEIQHYGFNFPYSQSNYRLVGIVSHSGNTIYVGHYISYMRHKQTNRWIRFNDSDLTFYENQPTIFQVLEKDYEFTPYLLVYQNFSESNTVSKQEQIEAYLNRFRTFEFNNI